MLKQIKDGHVKFERHNGVMTIEFSHPQSNSLPGAMLEALAHEVHAAGNDQDTKVIVLQSGGERAFCAGASFDELLTIETTAQGLEFFSGFANVINEMRKCPKFIIVRIQGKCVGGGVGIAAAADWARKRGLYAELHGTVPGLDESIARLANPLAHSNPEAMALLKQSLWKGTEHWDKLLLDRAAISGKLVIGAHSRQALQKIKGGR